MVLFISICNQNISNTVLYITEIILIVWFFPVFCWRVCSWHSLYPVPSDPCQLFCSPHLYALLLRADAKISLEGVALLATLCPHLWEIKVFGSVYCWSLFRKWLRGSVRITSPALCPQLWTKSEVLHFTLQSSLWD